MRRSERQHSSFSFDCCGGLVNKGIPHPVTTSFRVPTGGKQGFFFQIYQLRKHRVFAEARDPPKMVIVLLLCLQTNPQNGTFKTTQSNIFFVGAITRSLFPWQISLMSSHSHFWAQIWATPKIPMFRFNYVSYLVYPQYKN